MRLQLVSVRLDRPWDCGFAVPVSQVQLSLLLSLVFVTAVALAGYRPFIDEFRGRLRQTVAAFLLIAILALAVFFPVTSFGNAEDLALDMLWVPLLLVGHVVLATFLVAWWWLRGDVSAARFLHLSGDGLWSKLQMGVVAGAAGWVVTIMITGAAAAATTATGRVAEATEIPPVMAWLAELPWTDKLLIVVVAMTVEEAFFRAFLQARFGLVLSSVLFACSHFSYGLPFMIVGVFTISLIIGRVFARTGDLLPCMIAHGIFDGVQLFIVLPWAVSMWPSAPVA